MWNGASPIFRPKPRRAVTKIQDPRGVTTLAAAGPMKLKVPAAEKSPAKESMMSTLLTSPKARKMYAAFLTLSLAPFPSRIMKKEAMVIDSQPMRKVNASPLTSTMTMDMIVRSMSEERERG